MMLYTNRLDLIAATLAHVRAELDAPERLGELLNARVDPGWPPGEYDRGAQEFFREKLLQGGESAVGWYTWYAVLRQSLPNPAVLIGAGGYIGPPDEQGEVEIGFSILPAWEKRGYATELSRALVRHAFTCPDVVKVIAHTTEQNLASQKVLFRSGFIRTGKGVDPGQLRYEISRDNWSS